MGAPEKLRIPLDEYHFKNVGRLMDGTQFMAFVTGAFPSGQEHYLGSDWRHRKSWLAVTHRFDADGNHIRSEMRVGGLDIDGRDVAGEKAFHHLDDLIGGLAAGQEVEFCDIWVKLFGVQIDGIQHGLIYEQSEEDRDSDWVMLEPRDIMFHPPWDSGEYST